MAFPPSDKFTKPGKLAATRTQVSPQRSELMPDATDADAPIQHVSELPAYSPPAHSGTVNRRLVGREFGAGFEVILGRDAPGGGARRHYHVDETQIVACLKGEADVALGDELERRCGLGT